jgi:hypothetical protein
MSSGQMSCHRNKATRLSVHCACIGFILDCLFRRSVRACNLLMKSAPRSTRSIASNIQKVLTSRLEPKAESCNDSKESSLRRILVFLSKLHGSGNSTRDLLF